MLYCKNNVYPLHEIWPRDSPSNLIITSPRPPFIHNFVPNRFCPCFTPSEWHTHIMVTTVTNIHHAVKFPCFVARWEYTFVWSWYTCIWELDSPEKWDSYGIWSYFQHHDCTLLCLCKVPKDQPHFPGTLPYHVHFFMWSCRWYLLARISLKQPFCYH